MTNEKIIWNYFKNKGLTDAGIAGLIGNLYAESGLNPQNLQNSFEKKLNHTDASYTQAVDNQTYDNFIRDKAGYGLAQWTFWSRKQNLLQYAQNRKLSIGDLSMQLDFLHKELSESFAKVLQVLKTTNSVQEASNIVLLQFEQPGNQGESIQKRRYNYSMNYYNRYADQASETKPTAESITTTPSVQTPIVAPVLEMYYIRKTWEDTTSQKGVYRSLAKAKLACDTAEEGYFVFDNNGDIVYPEEKKTKFEIGDEIKLSPNAKYTSGMNIPAWVIRSKLYLREIRKNGDFIFSTQKTGAITGVVNPTYVQKVENVYDVKINTAALRVRSAPGLHGGVLGTVKMSTQHTILVEQNGWGKIRFGSTTGWISLNYTKKV